MEELKISKVLSDKLNIDEINSKTIAYRINSFINACNLNIDINDYKKQSKIYENYYTTGLIFNQNCDNQLEIFATKKQSDDHGDYVHIAGENDDLIFSFDNFYEKKKINQKIVDIPFNIYINKMFEGLEYSVKMESTYNKEVCFTFVEEDGHELCFYANILEFSKILNLVKAFISNPENVIRTYQRIMNNKKVIFTNGDLDKSIDKDPEFEKPAGKIRKLYKRIMNS